MSSGIISVVFVGSCVGYGSFLCGRQIRQWHWTLFTQVAKFNFSCLLSPPLKYFAANKTWEENREKSMNRARMEIQAYFFA